jgi:hypothetical protein
MPNWFNAIFLAGREPVQLPILVWLSIVLTTAAFALADLQVAGFSLGGWAWVIPFVLGTAVTLSGAKRISFPVWIVIPWCILLALNWYWSDYPATHRTAQLVCPLIVGTAVSSFAISEAQLRQVCWLLRVASLAALVAVLLVTGILATGSLPEATGLAAEVMTVALLCCYFAARYAETRESRELVLWGLLAFVPIIGVTRTGVVSVLLTLPLTFARLGFAKRLFGMVATVAAGLFTFYTVRFQQKMFDSGEGTLSDILDGDYKTSGRRFMWELFEDAIRDEPWLARGTGAGEEMSWQITDGMSGYPHNDWLLLSFDYSIAGAALFLVTLVALALHAYVRSRRAQTQEPRILLLAGASAFVPFAFFMYTDNISIYASFFGNLHFTMLGLGYAALRTAQEEESEVRRDPRRDFASTDGWQYDRRAN